MGGGLHGRRGAAILTRAPTCRHRATLARVTNRGLPPVRAWHAGPRREVERGAQPVDGGARIAGRDGGAPIVGLPRHLPMEHPPGPRTGLTQCTNSVPARRLVSGHTRRSRSEAARTTDERPAARLCVVVRQDVVRRSGQARAACGSTQAGRRGSHDPGQSKRRAGEQEESEYALQGGGDAASPDATGTTGLAPRLGQLVRDGAVVLLQIDMDTSTPLSPDGGDDASDE